nr:hypothetical protein [Tanacetum cinerariifolium]
MSCRMESHVCNLVDAITCIVSALHTMGRMLNSPFKTKSGSGPVPWIPSPLILHTLTTPSSPAKATLPPSLSPNGSTAKSVTSTPP